MQGNLTPKYIIIAIMLSWTVYALYPTWQFQNMSEDKKEELRSSGDLEQIESKIIRQGLDLRGGMYIVLEADIPTLVGNLADLKDERLSSVIKKAEEASVELNTDFLTQFRQSAELDGIKLSRYYFELGSTLDQILVSLEEESEDAINRVLEILQNRVDQFGVSEPTIQKQGKHRIVVELAGIQDSKRARDLLQSTALLEFYLVKNPSITNEIITLLDNGLKNDSTFAANTDDIGNTETEETVNNEATTVSELFSSESDTLETVDQLFSDAPFSSLLTALPGDLAVEKKNLYALKNLLNSEKVQSILNKSGGQFLLSNSADDLTTGTTEEFYRLYFIEKSPELTGGIVEEAKADLGSLGGGSAGQPVVSLTMNSEGSRTWSRVTGSNIGERIAIVLDRKVHMAPSIREKIPGGRTQIEGFSDINEAKDLAIILRAGALPAPVNIIEERIVGPSLGADSISQGTRAVIVGLLCVIVFMVIYYKIAGTVADFALIWNILLVLAILASLQATLTLPGIAGLILTVGMSIDANVIIFERIREELRKGKTPKAAIDSGYDRAITTIIDANVTTLIASLVLYQFGTGPIKGFATVLFWGILISMFTAVFITRTIFSTYVSRKSLSTLSI